MMSVTFILKIGLIRKAADNTHICKSLLTRDAQMSVALFVTQSLIILVVRWLDLRTDFLSFHCTVPTCFVEFGLEL